MIKPKIENVESLVETQFVSLYDVKYRNKLDQEKSWTVASRKTKDELKSIYLDNNKGDVDAVVVVAFHEVEDKLVLIKQFRVPINDYIYELPAGLVDKGENVKTSIIRELKEETGLELTSINEVMSRQKMYLSPGMTDESVALVYCTCKGEISKEYLEEDEDIEAILVSREEASEILKGNENVDIKAHLLLQQYVLLGDKLFK